MYDENDLIYSPLQQNYTADGKTVEVCIYRDLPGYFRTN